MKIDILSQFNLDTPLESTEEYQTLTVDDIIHKQAKYYHLPSSIKKDIPEFKYNHTPEIKDIRDRLIRDRGISKSHAKEILSFTKDIRYASEGYFTDYPSNIGYQETLADLNKIITSLESIDNDNVKQAFLTMLGDIKHKSLMEIQQESDLFNKVKSEINLNNINVEDIDFPLSGLNHVDISIIDDINDSLKSGKEISIPDNNEHVDLSTVMSSDIYPNAKKIIEFIIDIGDNIKDKDDEKSIYVMFILLNVYEKVYDVLERRHRLHLYLSHLENKE